MSLRGLQFGIVCVYVNERRKRKALLKNESLDDVHTNPDGIENASLSLNFELKVFHS